MTYDKMFKRRVLDYLEKGNTQENIAKTFGISKSALVQWKKQWEETGDFETNIRVRLPKKNRFSSIERKSRRKT